MSLYYYLIFLKKFPSCIDAYDSFSIFLLCLIIDGKRAGSQGHAQGLSQVAQDAMARALASAAAAEA